MKTVRALGALACGILVLWTSAGYGAPAHEKYPARPIRILIPFPAGGAADTVGRSLGELLSAQMGQPVVVDNRPGAAGRVATEMLTRAEPDGHTLLVGTPGAITVYPSLYRKLPYKVERDLLPITFVGEAINVMVVNPATGVKTVKEFIDRAKARPGVVRFGSSGTGQTDHLAGELFQRLTGVRLTHVPYKGGGPALIDLLSGDLQVMFPTSVVAIPHIRAGRLRALGVATPERKALFPDLPAVGETVAGFGFTNWDAIFAPAKTPAPIADRLFVEITKALQNTQLRKRWEALGVLPEASASRAAFAKFIREDTARWAKIVKEAGIHLD